MRRKNGKEKILVAASLLLCLLTLSLLPTVLSLDAGTTKVPSSGSVMYDLETALLVTDSIPEGGVPYTIDGNSSYQTGSTYTISAGVHVIELPSPYTSPSSNITYYFWYWQSGSTDNPRTVILDSGATASFYGLYSTSPEPPPPPPPPSSGYLAYTGMEGGSFLNSQPIYEDGWVGGWWVSYSPPGDSKTITSAKSWDVDVNGEASGHSLRMENRYASDSYRFALTTARGSSGIWDDFYLSMWVYIDEHYAGTWNQFFELREFDSASGKWAYPRSSLSLFLYGSGSNLYWMVTKGHTAENPTWCSSFQAHIRSDSWYWVSGHEPWKCNPDITEDDWTVNPHEVPMKRWFRLEIFVHRGSNQDGVFTVWITDPFNPDPLRRENRILFHIQNADTSDTAYNPALQNWEPAILKHYGMSLLCYYDELYLCDYNAHEG